MVTKNDVLKVLKECYDPEIPINVVDLGLIYGIKIAKSEVQVRMTLTAPGCPMADLIAADIKQKLLEIKGVKSASIEFVWDPPWNPEKMDPKARSELGI